MSQRPEKLTYDATFSGPKGELNPMMLKVPGILPVQVFPRTFEKWLIRNPQTKGQFSKKEFLSADQAINYCLSIFDKQESEWTIRDMLGNIYDPPEEVSAIPQLSPAVAVRKFNELFPIGTMVRYWRGARQGQPSGKGRINSAASILGEEAVAWIEGCRGAIALSHVEPIPVEHAGPRLYKG